MKFFFKLFVFFLVVGILAFPLILVFSSIENKALVGQNQELSFDNVKKVKKLIHDGKPSYLRKRQIKQFSVAEQDLNILVSYGVSHVVKLETLFSNIQLSDNKITTQMTLVLPANPVGKYINLTVTLKTLGTRLAVDHVKAGVLTLPGFFMNPAILLIDKYLIKSDIYEQIKENARSIKQIAVSDTHLNIIYEWNPNSLNKLHESGKTFLLSKEHQEKLVLYYNKLAEISQPFKNRKTSMAGIIAPMFRFAALQSKISNTSVLENTALLQVLSLYVTRTGLKNFIHSDILKQVKPPAKLTLLLVGRNDLPKHFLVSAGLAVSTGSKLANLIGLAKEVGDSDRGSGFSFADLAADKAGVKMGEMAIASEKKARIFQEKMGSVTRETDFMPAIDNLPEGIMELEFKKKYTDLDSDAYAMVNDEINKRINKCQVYR